MASALPRDRTHTMDLLNYDLETSLAQRPQMFREILEGLPSSVEWVVVDEVQKLPFLLDEVHSQIEKNPHRFFALTGSSARKLKRGKANLLAGRAFLRSLSPLTSLEIGKDFNHSKALSFGTLPKVVTMQNDKDKNDFLRAYAKTYLQEEIQMEGLIRNLQGFRNFLPLAAINNGQILTWKNFAQDVGVDAKTAQGYFQILEDTLLGTLLPAHHRSLRKRQKTHPKFYFFDTGVKRALAGELGMDLIAGTPQYGWAFEHFWITEIMRMSAYTQKDYRFSYFATNDIEIDLVLEHPAEPLKFVEIKSTERVKDAMLRPMQSLLKDVKDSVGLFLCKESRKRKVGNIWICPWQEALDALGFCHR